MRQTFRPLFAMLVGVAALATGPIGPSQAQPRGAMGRPAAPTPAEATLNRDLKAKTIAVTVLGDSKTDPQVGVDVTLETFAEQKVAPVVMRSDAGGSVTMTGTPGLTYRVSAVVGATTLQSVRFAMPVRGGISIVLSTKPAAAARGGRPSARMMSGRPRPEANDPSGRLTVRAIQGELKEDEFGAGLTADIPEGSLIHLVGLHSNGKFSLQTETVEAANEGRVVYKDLLRDNSVAYYAMAVFPRDGGVDRLMTQVLRMAPQVGSRMMFAGLAKDSAATGIDDTAQLAGFDTAAPKPGQVSVRIFAEQSQLSHLDNISQVELIRIGQGEGGTLRQPTKPADPDPQEVIGRGGPAKSLPGPGQVSFFAARPADDTTIPGVSIRIEGPNGTMVQTLTTDKDGKLLFTDLPPNVEYVPVATLFGKEVRGDKFTVETDKGLSFAFAFAWPQQTSLMATFSEVDSAPQHVYIAKVFANGRQFLSMPFQLAADKGASIGIYMYPKVLFSMRGGGELDDQKLWFQTRLLIVNPSPAPLDVGEGLLLPLPKGFVAASVAEEMMSQVGIEPEGFLWRGALPSGQRDFIATFALPTEDGTASFDMALPYGMRSGNLMLRDMPGMTIRATDTVETITQPNGRKYRQFQDIQIAPQKRFLFGVYGFPQHPAWQKYTRNGIGVLVLGLFGWILFAIFFGKRSNTSDRKLQSLEQERDSLMDSLVALQQKSKGEDSDALKSAKSKLTDVYNRIDEHLQSQSSQ